MLTKTKLKKIQADLFHLTNLAFTVSEDKTFLRLEYENFDFEGSLLALPTLIQIVDYFKVPYSAVNILGYGQEWAYSELTQGHDDYCVVLINKKFLDL